MIRQTIDLPEYNWTVAAYYAVHSYYAEEIGEKLVSLGASDSYVNTAVTHMELRTLNNGLTYSNLFTGSTVLVVSLTSSPAEFFNSLVHELQHLSSHICEAHSIDMASEEACYLSGSIARLMYPKISFLLTRS